MYISIETISNWPVANYNNPLLITGFAVGAMLVESSYVGWAVHAWDIRPESLTLGLKFIYTTQILFSAALTTIRLSMLWLISRLFQTGAPKLRRFTFGVMIYMLLHSSIFIITLIFQCRPVSDYWTISLIPQDNCINQKVHLLFTSICNAITDFVVVILPLQTVWKLQLPYKQRVSLCLLFAIGFLTSTASIIRTVYVYESTDVTDKSWATYAVYMWSSVELYLGLFCACIPPSVGFWKLYYPKVLGSFNRSEENTSKTRSFWSSSSVSKHDRKNAFELADTDDEERGIVVERGITIETYYSKSESMGSRGLCTAMVQSPALPIYPFKS
ncbi:hypothetical protein SBOR_2639 [Sclerotinia borealis F-4128]|uniref:Rhodopsin domain-containing protein n=1 Tax=Sclerotinia borealis (strain F-4128) TaxID=1432307 RepID=W9CJK6_SCLBF|nr:hypothetical protein SBOR_2639 [Sclerotinia borealis F-4128]